MRRWLALLLSVVVGAVLAYALTLAVAGAMLGILWLYVFGDDPWPAWSDVLINSAIVIGGFASWAFCSWTLWKLLRPSR